MLNRSLTLQSSDVVLKTNTKPIINRIVQAVILAMEGKNKKLWGHLTGSRRLQGEAMLVSTPERQGGVNWLALSPGQSPLSGN